MDQNNYTIGVDLGGTKIEVALVSSSGEVLHGIRSKTDVGGGFPAVVEEICSSISEIKKMFSKNIVSVGVGIAGQIDPVTGTVIFAPNLDWRNVPLQQHLHAYLNIPIRVTNDVRAATLGEWLYGAGKGCSDLVCVFVGTGIGGGIICSDKLLKGATNTAGEVGHMTIDRNGPLCTCGNKGCWEAYAGGWAIGKRARQEVADNTTAGKTLLNLAKGEIDLITAQTVSEAYAINDPLAVNILNDVADALIVGAANVVNILNPQKLIFGGGIIEGNPFFIEKIEKGIAQHALKAARSNIEVIKAKLGNRSGVIGAASLTEN